MGNGTGKEALTNRVGTERTKEKCVRRYRTNVADLKLEAVATRETQKKVSLCCRRCCTSLRGIHISSWGSVTMYLSVFVVFCILQTLKIRKKALL